MTMPWVVVTGAARGIGRAIAVTLSERGYAVAALDVDERGLDELALQLADAKLLTLICDVAFEDQVRTAFATIGEQTQTLAGLVNNAGIADPTLPPIEEVNFARWRRVLACNLDGPFLCTKYAAAALRRGGGAVVNIASSRALQSEANTEAYAASKGGLVSLTHALAMSLGPKVRVNAISPGWIDTSATEPSGTLASHRMEDHAQHPVGRIGQPSDVAELVDYLLSAKAGFITGQNFVVDGGMTKKMIYLE